jgi:hypothetical protein
MPRTGWTPSIVPKGNDESVYLVVDDFGRNGRVYREADVETTDLETVILDLLEGQYQSPVRVVAFNTAEKWSQDVSADVAHELRQRCDLQMRDVPFFLQDFVDQYEGRYRDVQLPLPMQSRRRRDADVQSISPARRSTQEFYSVKMLDRGNWSCPDYKLKGRGRPLDISRERALRSPGGRDTPYSRENAWLS